MDGPTRIRIRRNCSGSCKMRIFIQQGKRYTQYRLQFGLGTTNIRLAVLRAKAIWHALKFAGYIQTKTAVCTYDLQHGGFKKTIIWKENSDQDIFLKIKKDAKDCQLRKSTQIPSHRLDLQKNGSGEFLMRITILFLKKKTAHTTLISLRTTETEEANDRGHIIFRVFSRIISRITPSIKCAHGIVHLKKTSSPKLGEPSP